MNRPESPGADDLRRLLEDAVSDVHPRDGLDEIRARSEKVVPMNRRWLPISLSAAAAMVLVIGGTLWLTDRDPDPVGGPIDQPSATAPTGTDDPTDDPTGDPTGDATTDVDPAPVKSVAIPVYYVGDTPRGPRLYREFQRTPDCAADCRLTAAVDAAVGGKPQDPDYRAPWPAGSRAGQSTSTGDLITVDLLGDLHDRPSGMTAEQAELAVEQVLFTAQAATGKGRLPVQLLLDGERTDQVLGVPTSEPLASADELSVLAPVSISSPNEGDVLTSGFTVTGRAAAFEANVVWELRQAGRVVKNGFTTAEECCRMAPYSFKVDAPPGDYTLVVQDTDPSGGEGPGVTQDTRTITIR